MGNAQSVLSTSDTDNFLHTSAHHNPLQNTGLSQIAQLKEWSSGILKNFYWHFTITKSAIECTELVDWTSMLLQFFSHESIWTTLIIIEATGNSECTDKKPNESPCLYTNQVNY